MAKRASETTWVELGFLPADVGYVPNAAAWEETLKLLDLPREDYPSTDGRCVRWTREGSHDVILITVPPRARNYEMAQVVGIIAHECMHAWRYIREGIGEDAPSTEFEAYVMQALVQTIIQAHAQSRKHPWKGRTNG